MQRPRFGKILFFWGKKYPKWNVRNFGDSPGAKKRCFFRMGRLVRCFDGIEGVLVLSMVFANRPLSKPATGAGGSWGGLVGECGFVRAATKFVLFFWAAAHSPKVVKSKPPSAIGGQCGWRL